MVQVFGLLMSIDTCHLLVHDVADISDSFVGFNVGGDDIGSGEVGERVKL